jgi:saccharopine dehydrogenase-like NADP-dependent oxidoreductase
MKVLIVGCGNIGSVAAEDLVKSMSSIQVVVADKSKTRAKEVTEKIGKSNVSCIELDATDHGKLVHAMRDFNLVMGFLPGKLGYQLTEACIDAGKDLVDVSFMAENPLTLTDNAAKAKATIVPDCGLAPGISNVLVGHAAAELDKVQAVHIMVGGLPQKPIPPLDYVVTWSPENLIDEYMRKAKIVKEGQIAEVEALSGLEEMQFPGLGKLEAFYTDGLRTLPQTITGAYDMWEKTLRYPGHAEKIRLLRTLGFFDEKQIDVDGLPVSPRKVTVKLLGQKLRKPEVKDVVALKVEVSGVKNGKQTSHVYHLLDYYDEKSGVTAMARTTAYSASTVAQLILKKALKEKGVVTPERIGMDNKLFKSFLESLEKHGIEVTEERKTK